MHRFYFSAENIVSVLPTVCQWLLPGKNMKKLSGLLTLTNVNMNPKCGKMLRSEMNFILTDCWVKQSLTQPTQQQQPLRKKIVHLVLFGLSVLPVSWFSGISCKQLHSRRLESLVWFIPSNLPCECRPFFSSQDCCSQFFNTSANKSYPPTRSWSCC